MLTAMRWIAVFAVMIFVGRPASAEPVLKVVNFTADWCPNCQVLNPALENALTYFDDGDIVRIDLDMTQAHRRASEAEKSAALAAAITLANENDAGYLWGWYGGVTGIAAIISADNGEPISCLTRALDEDDIRARINEAMIIARRRPAGARMPQGPDCPAPLR